MNTNAMGIYFSQIWVIWVPNWPKKKTLCLWSGIDFSQRVNDVGPPPRINQLDALALDQEMLATFQNYLADSFKFFLKYSAINFVQN